MKQSKILLLVVLLFTATLVGCQSSGQGDADWLGNEIVTLKKELHETQNALKRAEAEIEALKIARIKSSIEELERLVQVTYQEGDLSKDLETFAQTQSIDIASVYFATVEGAMLIWPQIDLPEDDKMTERPIFTEALDKEVYIADVYMDFVENRRIQTLSKAVYIDGDWIGVLGIDVFLDE